MSNPDSETADTAEEPSMTSSSEAIPRCQECGQELWKLDGRTIYGDAMWMHARHNDGPWKRTKHPPKPPVKDDVMTSSSDRTEQTDAARIAKIEAIWFRLYKAWAGSGESAKAVKEELYATVCAPLLARLQEVERDLAIAQANQDNLAAILDTGGQLDQFTARAEAAEALNRKQEEVIAGAYRERDAIAAALGRLFPSWVGTDADEPDWPVLYINLPTGQVSWHYAPTDADLLTGIARGTGVWDGHTTEEKYTRLAALAAFRVTGEEQEA